MLESVPVSIIFGVLLGFLSGLGTGGGSLLILWLTLVIGMDYGAARTLNLLFFIPSALITTIFRRKQEVLHFKKILPAILAGCASAALFSTLGKHINTEIIKKLFGFLLLLTGVRELIYKPKQKRPD